MKNSCTLYLVRHGRTDWNEQKKITGSTDIPLSEIGIKQSESFSKTLQQIHFDAIFSSDLLRAKQTAEIIAKERKIAIITSKFLRERNFGAIEGRAHKEWEQLLDMLRELTEEEAKTYKFDNLYESDEELIARIITFLREVAVAYVNKTVLMVTHGGLLRSLLIHLGYSTHKDAPMRFIHNAGFVKLESDGIDFKILEVNPGEVIS